MCRRLLLLAAVCLACTGAPSPGGPVRTGGEPAARPNGAPGPEQPKPPSGVALELYDAIVDVGALRLHIVCAGTGAPTVVLEAGLGLDGSVWRGVKPQVAALTRTCAYDRAGRGLSGPAPQPHGQRQMARELYALLETSRQRGPYVLVGHSMGGAIVRWFLAEHEAQTAGMVLIEPATEEWPERVLARVPAQALPEFWDNLRTWEGLDRDTYLAGYDDLPHAAGALGAKPLVILTAGRPAEDLTVRTEMHGKLRRLSSNSLHAVVDESAHLMPLDAPERLVAAVRAVVSAARTGSRLTESALASGGAP